jgi:hypothetical protein
MAGPLASLLMGVGNRAAEVSRRDEERAYEQQSEGRRLASESLIKMLEDPTRTYEDQQRIAGQLEDLHKMKKGSLQDAFKYATQLHPHIERAVSQGQQPMPPIPEMKAGATYSATPSATTTIEPPVTIRGGALQGQQAPATVQPNVQMQTMPQFQQLAPMPQPPVGLNPQGKPGLGGEEAAPAPANELERKQQAHLAALEQHLNKLKAMGASPEILQESMRAGIGISPAVQAAQVRAGSAENVARINALGKQLAGNTGNFVTVQEPGADQPTNVFQITKGPLAGTMLDANTKQPIQLAAGFKKLMEHPDQKTLVTDPEGNVRTVNVTQGKVESELGKIGTPKGGANAGELTPEGLSMAAEQFAKTGQLPAMGMGAAGIRTQIINEAAKKYPKIDLASNKAAYTSNQASLTQMQKNRDAVVTWEGTALKNLKIFEDAAKPIIDSGSPLLNYPLRIASQKAAGSKEMAAFNTARTVALTEIAKVLNNPNLSGQLTNEARAEAMALAPDTATLAQIYSVVKILKQDMGNRHDELDTTIDAIKERIGRNPGEPAKSSGSEKRGLGNPPSPPTAVTGVRMKAPDGSIMPVPPELVEKYKKKGAVVVP